MKNFLAWWERQRVTRNIVSGTSIGLELWLLHIVFYRVFGLQAPFLMDGGLFMTVGAGLGALIGLISHEVSWHKEKHH